MLCNNARTHCCIAIATLLMSICHCVALCTLPVLKLRKRKCSNCTANIRHHCIKFSYLGNRVPEICAPLHDVKKQDHHFFLLPPFGEGGGGVVRETLLPVGCYVFWLWGYSGIRMTRLQ